LVWVTAEIAPAMHLATAGDELKVEATPLHAARLADAVVIQPNEIGVLPREIAQEDLVAVQ
jgi:hypothetical protein